MTGIQQSFNPTAVTLNPPWALGTHCAVFGTGSALTALTDGTDATYVATTASDGGECLCVFGSIPIPANSVIYGVYLNIRVKNVGNQDFVSILDSGATARTDNYLQNTPAFQLQGTALIAALGGGAEAITVAMLNAGMQALIVFGNTTMQVSEIALVVAYDAPPAVAITSPAAGAVLNTTLPTFTWSYTPPFGTTEPQTNFLFSVFTDDGTNQQVYTSGFVVNSQVTTHTVTKPLPANVPLYATVAASAVGNPNRYSPFAPSLHFVVSVPTPATPLVIPTWDPGNGLVKLNVQGVDNMLEYAGSAAEGTPSASLGPVTGATINQSTGQLYTPPTAQHPLPHSWLATSTAAGTIQVISKLAACLPGMTCTGFLAALADPATALRNVGVNLAFYAADGVTIISTNIGAQITETRGVWAVPTIQGTAPLGTAFVALVAGVVGVAAAGENHYLAALEVAPVSLASLLPRVPTGQTAVPIWTRGGVRTAGQSIVVEHSNDGGDTWQPIRDTALLVPNTASQLITSVTDREAAPLTRVMYRAHVASVDQNGAALNSPTSASLPNPGFEQSTVAFWQYLNLTPVLDTEWVHPGRGGRQSLRMDAPPVAASGPYYVVGSMRPQPWQGSCRFRGWWRAQNVSQLVIATAFYDANNAVVTLIPAVGYMDVSSPTPFAMFDTGDVPLPGNATFAAIYFGFLRSFDALSYGNVWIDDIEGLVGGSYVQTDSSQSWLKNPLVSGQNLPIQIEPKSSSGGGVGGSQLGVLSEAQAPETVVYGEGNPYPIVLHDVAPADTFRDCVLYLPNDAAWAAFDSMHRSQQTLLLQGCQGDSLPQQAYVQIVGIRQHHRLTSQDHLLGQRHRVICSFVEVAAP